MNTTNNIPQETINELIVDILGGAKHVSGEIYGASKIGIVKAVDFAQEQAPLVVQEFLRWKLSEAIISITAFVIISTLLVYVFVKFKQIYIGKSIGMTALCIVAIMIGSSYMISDINQIVKIKVAPRVYLIEWVSSLSAGK